MCSNDLYGYAYMDVCVCSEGQCFSTLCWSASPSGDSWATAIRCITLTTVARLDSVCQAQDAD